VSSGWRLAGTFCLDSFGTGWDTVIRVLDAECTVETVCDDDGYGFVGYPSDYTSMVDFLGTEGETVIIMLDTYSSAIVSTSWELTIAEGPCPVDG